MSFARSAASLCASASSLAASASSCAASARVRLSLQLDTLDFVSGGHATNLAPLRTSCRCCSCRAEIGIASAPTLLVQVSARGSPSPTRRAPMAAPCSAWCWSRSRCSRRAANLRGARIASADQRGMAALRLCGYQSSQTGSKSLAVIINRGRRSCAATENPSMPMAGGYSLPLVP